MAAAPTLTSDHVNFMILRYLQEHGHDTTAVAFWRDWQRQSEHHNPEALPFAGRFQRNELVSVIQQGLAYDELQARLRKNERRFQWTENHVHESTERQGEVVENGAASRPSSSGKRKGRSPSMRARADLPAQLARQQGRSEDSEAHVNGDRDAMDIDAASPLADADDDMDATSQVLAAEHENNDTMERYDSMDVSTQTDIKTGPKTDTIHWTIDKPGAAVWHSMWNPDWHSENVTTLLTVGESLCRLYKVPVIDQESKEVTVITHVDQSIVPRGFVVTAAAWRPDGRSTVCAINGLRQQSNGNMVSSHELIEYDQDAGNPVQLQSPVLDKSSIVLHMQYSPDARYLLVARTAVDRGSIQVWEASPAYDRKDMPRRHPIAWRLFDSQVMDVAWIANDAFAVCGDNGLSAVYQLDLGRQDHLEEEIVTSATIPVRGLISHNSNVLPLGLKWDKVRYDRRHRLAAFASAISRRLVITPRIHGIEDLPNMDDEVDLPGDLTALAFQPFHLTDDPMDGTADYGIPTLLAVTFEDGSCMIYSVDRGAAVGERCTKTALLHLLDGPALALAWSPSGDHLAVGNTDLVQVWHRDSFRRTTGVPHTAEASVTWSPASSSVSMQSEQHTQDTPLSEPSLGWSADGESLAFAVDKQVAVIRFRPSLKTEAQEPEPGNTPS